MIDILVHRDLLIFLRAFLLLGPMALTLYFGWKRRHEERVLVGGFFSFLYGFSLLLPAHVFAMHVGFWHYGDNALMFLGMPADIWFAGALLFGPAIFYAWPSLNPWIPTLGYVALIAIMLPSLDPFVITGNNWFSGVLFVFLVVHVPSLFLARWTAQDVRLPERATLLAFAFGLSAYFIIPSIIMYVMGGLWADAFSSHVRVFLTAIALVPCVVMGLTSVQMFVIHGEGTPIPLDKTKHLVRSGLYSYLSNPMQCATALSWIVLGTFLGNLYVILASVMAVVFVLGMVRWHHRIDLCVRFPEGWPEFKENVHEWFPRWKPWIKYTSCLTYNESSNLQRFAVRTLQSLRPIGLSFKATSQGGFIYRDGNRGRELNDFSAFACSLFHINFLAALIGSGFLLLLLPADWLCSRLCGAVGTRHA